MSEVVTPHTRAAAAALRGTLTPVQLTRRLEREHSAAPLTPRQQAAARRLARNVITLPEGSAQRARDMINLEKWLKELEGRRSFRLFIKEMQAADAHHQRVLAQQEKEKQRKQQERMIRKQKEANKRLRAHYLEACNQRAGDERIRKRRAVYMRPTKEPRPPDYIVGRRGAR